MKSRQIDKDWETLLNRYPILETVQSDGFFIISSRQINQVHEARLMTKFDNRENLPSVFRENHLSILPVSRGNYIIGTYDAYQNVRYGKKAIKSLNLPSFIESINPSDLYSESACLNCAYASGIIDDLCGGHTLPAVSGRMSSNSFEFQIKSSRGSKYQKIQVKNSQVEIDGGYESEDALFLIEAKNYSADDFLIRQLYYPYRLWSTKIRKAIIPVFMTFSNDIFSFFIYKFQDTNVYNSIQFVEQKNYMIAPEPIVLKDIRKVLASSEIAPEPKVPFPQCDNFSRIVDLLALLAEKGELTPDEITSNYAFVPRQTGYYTNGAIYVGLVHKCKNENNETVFTLTDLGKQIMRKRHKEKSLSIAAQVLKHEAFHKVLKEYLRKLSPLTIQEISEVLKGCHLYHVGSRSTLTRRASTVEKWIDWILNLQEA